MKQIVFSIAVLSFITACSSAPQPKSKLPVPDNGDVAQLNCERLADELSLTADMLDRLKKIRNLENSANAVSVVGALLSFNPFLLTDLKSNQDTVLSEQAFKERQMLLQRQHEKLSCPLK
ncbi:Uncharacterised protein [Neisseria dentiae]|nr:Uncharacterised protein [Neisseria dentiae]